MISIIDAAASTIPLPRPRPPEAAAVAQPTFQVIQPDELSACALRLIAIADFQSLSAVETPNGCGAADAVRLDAILLRDRVRIGLRPPAVLRCPMAEQIAHWVRDDVVPAVAGLGAALAGIDNFDSYDCRGRNRVAGARLSEHARANALDLRGFLLVSKTVAGLTDPAFSRPFREEMRRSACARFTTVLGPGSDGFHEDHVHLDLAERRGGYRICQWDVRDPAPEIPLPRPRPAIAETATE